MDTEDWPRPNIKELPDLYEDLDDHLDSAEDAIRKHIPVEERDGIEYVKFGEASEDDILDFMQEDPEATVMLLQKISGFTDREWGSLYQEKGLGTTLTGYKTDFRDRDNAQTFAEAMVEHLPNELHLETVLYTFFTMWENDQRRFYRMYYEEEVNEHLREHGFDAGKDETLKGQPDIVISRDGPIQVIGETRVMKLEDFRKRIKNFRDEAREAAINHPDCYFVVVASMPTHALENRREEIRGEINSHPRIDRVFFSDELDDLVEQLEDWGVNKMAQSSE